MKWTPDLDTGIVAIDAQHRIIVKHINLLERAHREHERQMISHVLAELVSYTLSHFAYEEALQIESGYKLAEAHKASHEAFIKRVARYRQRHHAGEDIAEQLHGMLRTWLLHHIKRDDAAYVAAIRPDAAAVAADRTATGWLSRTLGTIFNPAPDNSPR
jgi:hemerythrin